MLPIRNHVPESSPELLFVRPYEVVLLSPRLAERREATLPVDPPFLIRRSLLAHPRGYTSRRQKRGNTRPRLSFAHIAARAPISSGGALGKVWPSPSYGGSRAEDAR